MNTEEEENKGFWQSSTIEVATAKAYSSFFPKNISAGIKLEIHLMIISLFSIPSNSQTSAEIYYGIYIYQSLGLVKGPTRM